ARRVGRVRADPVRLPVAVLASREAAAGAAVAGAASPVEHATRLAELAVGSGVRGLVCSAAEAAALRARLGPDPVLVTPGIRPGGHAGKDDQKRVGTPADAIRAGASLLVVGRPIRDAAGAWRRRRCSERSRRHWVKPRRREHGPPPAPPGAPSDTPRLILGIQPVRAAIRAHGARLGAVLVESEETPRLAALARFARDQ